LFVVALAARYPAELGQGTVPGEAPADVVR
jgi:hypothetical protein